MADFRELISHELSALGHPPEPEEFLDAMLIRYLNLQRRIPPILAWTIKQSKYLTAKTLKQSARFCLDQFIKKAKSGQNLKPYISKNINHPDFYDFMFYDWEFFHFHLKSKLNSKHPELFERTNDILFAIADSNRVTMYLLDIQPHGNFVNQSLLKIIEDNWPKILDKYTLKDVKLTDADTEKFSDKDIDSFRKAGVNTTIQTPSGRILSPKGKDTKTARTGVSKLDAALDVADDMITRVDQLEEWFAQQKVTLEHHFQYKYGKSWNELIFKVRSFKSLLKIEEITTGELLEFPNQ